MYASIVPMDAIARVLSIQPKTGGVSTIGVIVLMFLQFSLKSEITTLKPMSL